MVRVRDTLRTPIWKMGCVVLLATSAWHVACRSTHDAPVQSLPTVGSSIDSHRYDLPLSRAQALEILLGTETFADTMVGIAGIPSHQACAFRVVLDQPDADSLFKRILADAHLAGQLYALCGLYFTDPTAFLHAVEPFRTRTDAVETYQGCISSPEGVSSLVELNLPTVVRLRDRAESTSEWLARNSDLVTDGYRLDMLGGGWPARLKEIRGCDGQ